MGLFGNRKIQKNVKAAVEKDPLFVQKVSREKQIVFDSVSIMEKTTSADTLIHRYSDAIGSIDRFNSLVSSIGEDPCDDVRADIVAVFCRVLPDVVKGEVDDALALKTEKGRRKRLLALLDVVEGCDREEGDVVDEAVGAAEDTIFAELDRATDWSKEGDKDLTPDRDSLVRSMKAGVRKILLEKGLSTIQADILIDEAFKN